MTRQDWVCGGGDARAVYWGPMCFTGGTRSTRSGTFPVEENQKEKEEEEGLLGRSKAIREVVDV